ncbi:MAG: hypothetical protein KBT46_05700 [Ruminococcus sp.]|nr:hypothetical protein [Candidatus Copronaster equi]
MKKVYLSLFCLIFVFCGCSCSSNNKDNDKKIIQITDGVYVTDIFPYNGEVTEDSSGLKSANVLCLTVKNTSGKHYEYLNFELFSGGQRYKFSVYTLFNGSSVKVFEKDSAKYNENIKVTSTVVVDYKIFSEKPTVHLDKFKISCLDGIINIENITDTDFKNVKVYFKYVDSDVFLGGLTYCVDARDLHSGQIVQISAEKYKKNNSKVVFVTYDK